MKMTFRWYGDKADTISLNQIRQIGYVKGIISTLYDIPAGEVWPRERIHALKTEVEAEDLTLDGIESVNIHDDIKIGLPSRDKYIENYIKTLEALGEEGIHLVCYNFMPVFDWTRTDLRKPRPDGSTVMAYDQKYIEGKNPLEFAEEIRKNSLGHDMPGWEPERLAHVLDLFAAYKDVDEDKLFSNMVYFLKAIGPVCEKYDMKMAVHPDDPAWPVFGLPRIVRSKETIAKILKAVDKPYNGLTFCAGSLGTNPKNDLPGIIRSFPGRIHFAHVRNLHHFAPGVFEEAVHLSSDGSFDLYEICKALYDIHFEGPIRPDHGRNLWGEQCMPGYGLYDRALGAAYICGLWEATEKSNR
ncbi:MAG: mannonate dehydratase [Spirochaetaceae bacterium]|nr:mannonate dehydratase [Spirochaetaceae bacterium]